MKISKNYLAGILIFFSMGIMAQSATPPKDAKGATARVLAALNLGPEFAATEGRILKLQFTTYAPGSASQIHSHKDKPEVVYMVSGKVIEHQGDVARVYGPGEPFIANKDTKHWMENSFQEPAVLMVATITPQ